MRKGIDYSYGVTLVPKDGTSKVNELSFVVIVTADDIEICREYMNKAGADSPSSTEKISTWAIEQVNAAIALNFVPQSLQSKYQQDTTRAEFCAFAVALYENVKGEIAGRTKFTDTNDVNVEKMAFVGVVNGVGDNKFDPNANLTREQAAALISRLAEKIGKPLPKQAATFADNSLISSWAIENVGQVQAAGIMGGIGNNLFSPKGPYTREQSIVTIMRLYEIVK